MPGRTGTAWGQACMEAWGRLKSPAYRRSPHDATGAARAFDACCKRLSSADLEPGSGDLHETRPAHVRFKSLAKDHVYSTATQCGHTTQDSTCTRDSVRLVRCLTQQLNSELTEVTRSNAAQRAWSCMFMRVKGRQRGRRQRRSRLGHAGTGLLLGHAEVHIRSQGHGSQGLTDNTGRYGNGSRVCWKEHAGGG